MVGLVNTERCARRLGFLWAGMCLGLGSCVETGPVVVHLRDAQTHEPVRDVPLMLYVRHSTHTDSYSGSIWDEHVITGADGTALFERVEVFEYLWLEAALPPDGQLVYAYGLAHPKLGAANEWLSLKCRRPVRWTAFYSVLGPEETQFPYEVMLEDASRREP
jgi:hypothetical protein